MRKTLTTILAGVMALGLAGCDKELDYVRIDCKTDIDAIQVVDNHKKADFDLKTIELYSKGKLVGEFSFMPTTTDVKNIWYRCENGQIVNIDNRGNISYRKSR
ncbi:hypothetical protein GOV03_04555 [Candidatus Woesearchaeota archaeon]|nr:hypothetical protein [Candidatus Woesearchaeota archaeon]